MKTITVLLTLLFAHLPSLAAASDYLDKFERLKKADNGEEMQKFLSGAAESEKANPDYYATAGNYWWQLSQKISITTKPSEGDDFSVRDQKTGKEVGSISSAGQANPEIPKRALNILMEGAKRFPQRADIVLGLASVQHKMRLKKECVDTLLNLLATSKKNPEALRWTKDGHLPSKCQIFIPQAIHHYSANLYNEGNAAADALCAKLCDATIDAFPEHSYAYNIKAAMATARGDKEEALRCLQIASTKAPDDPLILLNLGDAYRGSGNITKAKAAYEKVLKIDKVEDSDKEAALKAIKDLETAPPGQPATKPIDKVPAKD